MSTATRILGSVVCTDQSRLTIMWLITYTIIIVITSIIITKAINTSPIN